jgi:hypothetical protein
LIIDGSGSGHLTKGSGSRRPKNTRILWIRIRIRIRNTGKKTEDKKERLRIFEYEIPKDDEN